MTAASDVDNVKRYLPWVVATTLFMEQLDSTIVNTAVPAMAANLHVAPLSLKAVVTSYILSLAVCIPVSGWLADRYGTARVRDGGGAVHDGVDPLRPLDQRADAGRRAHPAGRRARR